MKSHLNFRNYFVVLMCLAVLGMVWSTPAFSVNELTKLLASDGAAGDWFGYSTSIFGDVAIVGSRYDDNNGSNSGSAYIAGPYLIPCDLDADNDVDLEDYSLFAEYWLETDCGPSGCNGADFTGDGQVNIYDLKELCDSWLRGK